MANFFLIDQSLQHLGGHHYDYARCVAAAAQQTGYQTTIGTSQKFQNGQSLANFGNVRRSFRQTTYHPDSYLSGLRHLTRSNADYLDNGPKKRQVSIRHGFKGVVKKWQLLKHRARRERFIRSFAQDCQRFFANQPLSENDHAFFATVNEMELMGLAAFLSNHPRTLQVTWHLQFHFNLFDGRTPEYQSQHRVARAVQGCFDAALARIPYHHLNFYTTSETLADQFNRLRVGRFEELAYPVRPELFEKRQRASNTLPISRSVQRPLKITCPGEVRREKKFIEYLQPLVDDIWDRHLATSDVQLVLQRPKRKWPAKEKIELLPPASVPPGMATNEIATLPPWIEYFQHPLSDADYLNLLNDTDIGLLFYDSRAYFSRRAGVLGELLSCGKPVIVPAGCWLADQIQEPIFQHVDRLLLDADHCRKLELDALSWPADNVPHTGGVVSFGKSDHPFAVEFELQPEENAFVVEFDWHWPQKRGVYCRLECFDQEQISKASSVQVVGHRDHKQAVTCFFRTTATRIRLQLSNAYHESSASVKNLSIYPMTVTQDMPVGAVGVVAADEREIANAVDEMVNHYDYYRNTAVEFSNVWCRQHEPRQTVSHLVSAKQPFSKAG